MAVRDQPLAAWERRVAKRLVSEESRRRAIRRSQRERWLKYVVLERE